MEGTIIIADDDVSIRTVQDDSQYQKRLEEFDFDMVVSNFGSIISPGNEQKNWWGSKAADQPGSMNISGVKNPIIDEIIEKLIMSENREDLIIYSRVLDRLLLFNHYLIPQFHIGHYRVAYWNKYSKPKISPKYDLGFDFWWFDTSKNNKLGKIDSNNNTKQQSNNSKYLFFLVLLIFYIFYKFKKKNV